MGATIKIAILAQAAKAKAELNSLGDTASGVGDRVKKGATVLVLDTRELLLEDGNDFGIARCAVDAFRHHTTAFTTSRPIRPNPFTPTLIAITFSFSRFSILDSRF